MKNVCQWAGRVKKLRAVEDQSAPIPEETTSELGRIIWDTIVLPQFSHSATELFAPWKISFDQFILGVGYIWIVGRHLIRGEEKI